MTLKQDLQDQQSFRDIIHWLEIHPEFLWQHNPHKELKMPDDFWLKITFLDVMWYGGKRWRGHMEIQTSHLCNISDMLGAVGIHTKASLAIPKDCYGYEVTFFEAEWPGLEKMRSWAILQDKTPWAFTEGSSSRYY